MPFTVIFKYLEVQQDSFLKGLLIDQQLSMLINDLLSNTSDYIYRTLTSQVLSIVSTSCSSSPSDWTFHPKCLWFGFYFMTAIWADSYISLLTYLFS